MTNLLYRLIDLSTSNYFRLALVLMTLMGLASIAGAQANTANTIVCSIAGVYNGVKTTIFVLGLLLMILGGALYAGSHIMPGQSKGTVQGYGMGMIIGGVIGVIIALVSPYILGLIIGVSITGPSSLGTNAFGC